MTLNFTVDRSDRPAILWHLHCCDASFHPPLSTRVVLDDYASKLAKSSTRFEAWADGRLVGLVAVYCNAPDSGTACVSNVSVLPESTGRGIGHRLLVNAIDHAHALGFTQMSLEVDANASSALRLYEKLGFRQADQNSKIDTTPGAPGTGADKYPPIKLTYRAFTPVSRSKSACDSGSTQPYAVHKSGVPSGD